MSAPAEAQLERLVEMAARDPEILAVILFGSRARHEGRSSSDTDVCLVLGDAATSGRASYKRLDYLAEADLDISVYQQLPLHIRVRVLKEGRVLFVRDEDALYEIAFRTVRAYEDFKHIQRLYLDEIARG